MPPRVLVVADFTGNTAKVERHVGPLARVADPTMVCVTPTDAVDGLACVSGPTTGSRPVNLAIMFAVTVLTAARGEYDAVASFSLFPHGCFALVAGAIARAPVHLGIIGIDVDVHASAWYGGLTRTLIRRFSVVSVPGTRFAATLRSFGVPASRIETLANAIDPDAYPISDGGTHTYDYLWIARFRAEKQPMVFLEALAALSPDADTRAVMVGDGPLLGECRKRCRDLGLADVVDFPGWVDDTGPYYRDSRLFVLTSARDALPLTLLEAMASGCVPVVPPVGNVPDVAVHGETAYVLDDASPDAVATAIETLEADPELRAHIADNAPAVRERYSYDAAAADWQAILARMLDGPTRR